MAVTGATRPASAETMIKNFNVTKKSMMDGRWEMVVSGVLKKTVEIWQVFKMFALKLVSL
jgi:hypothetical protein